MYNSSALKPEGGGKEVLWGYESMGVAAGSLEGKAQPSSLPRPSRPWERFQYAVDWNRTLVGTPAGRIH